MKKLVLIVISAFFLLSCRSVQIGIDKYSLNRNKNAILENFSPGDPEELQKYISSYDLNRITSVTGNIRPEQIIPLEKWHIKTDKKINYEKWIFTSSFFEDDIPGDSIFYVFRQKPWEESKVILFVPGFGVSDFAFRFLKKIFISEIEAGYNIVIYIPPYHLDRQEKGKSAGEGLLTSSPLENVRKMTNSVKEIREVYRYLESRDIQSIGLWSGSMGGAFSLLLQSLETFDHLALMIPVIDWNSFITPEPVMFLYGEIGFDKELIEKGFSLISPENYKLNIPADRIQIAAAEFDQLIPIESLQNFAEDNNINNFQTYPSGHATILLYKNVYRDYSEFLSNLQ